MKKLIPAALALALLAGCNASPGLVRAPGMHTGAMAAQSAAGVNKAMRGMFKLVFSQYDKDLSGGITIEEAPGSLTFGPAPEGAGDPKAVMAKLDLNVDGKVTLYEFSRRDIFQPVLTRFRYETGKQFAEQDRNGDRSLTEDELAPTGLKLMDLDRNVNGKVTLSEYEDALANIFAEQGSIGGPVNPPAPPAPVEPADPADPGNAPADPGGDPGTDA